MKSKKFVIAVVAMLLVLSAVPAFADGGSIALTGGSITLTSDSGGFAFGNLTLDGNKLSATDETGTGSDSSTWGIVDARGTGAGWRISVKSSDLTGLKKNDGTTAATFTLASSMTPAYNEFGLKLQLVKGSDVAVKTGAEGSTPVSGLDDTNFSTANFLTASDQVALKAAVDQGMGGYDIDPLYTIYMPAGAYAGSGSLTLTITKSDSAS